LLVSPTQALAGLGFLFLNFVFKTLHFKYHSKVKNHQNKSQVTEEYAIDFGLKI
jgi:hypothetical protein